MAQSSSCSVLLLTSTLRTSSDLKQLFLWQRSRLRLVYLDVRSSEKTLRSVNLHQQSWRVWPERGRSERALRPWKCNSAHLSLKQFLASETCVPPADAIKSVNNKQAHRVSSSLEGNCQTHQNYSWQRRSKRHQRRRATQSAGSRLADQWRASIIRLRRVLEAKRC